MAVAASVPNEAANGSGLRRNWDWWINKVADVPVGVILAIVAIIVMFVSSGFIEQAKALLTAAGLFGIGHGIHMMSRRSDD